MDDIEISGTMIEYYFICKKHLWLTLHNINMEYKSELVRIGKIIDETCYGKNKKHINILDKINLDFIDNHFIINEIKPSKYPKEYSKWQIKYYLYFLKKLGVNNVKGKLVYPKIKTIIKIDLSESDEKCLLMVIKEIEKIKNMNVPPEGLSKSKCKNCSFFDLCYC